jgi:putative acetyltransferase
MPGNACRRESASIFIDLSALFQDEPAAVPDDASIHDKRWGAWSVIGGHMHASECRASLPLTFRPAAPEDAGAVSALVQASFRIIASSDWAPAAVARFLQESSEGELRKKLQAASFAWVATSNGIAQGFILMKKSSRVDMLFVHPSSLRRGIGRALLNGACAHVESTHLDVSTIDLNSTPYALPFYRASGFVAIGRPFELNGARVTRMAYRLR